MKECKDSLKLELKVKRRFRPVAVGCCLPLGALFDTFKRVQGGPPKIDGPSVEWYIWYTSTASTFHLTIINQYKSNRFYVSKTHNFWHGFCLQICHEDGFCFISQEPHFVYCDDIQGRNKRLCRLTWGTICRICLVLVGSYDWLIIHIFKTSNLLYLWFKRRRPWLFAGLSRTDKAARWVPFMGSIIIIDGVPNLHNG